MKDAEVFYIKVTGYTIPRYFGAYSSSEFNPQKTLRDFQEGLRLGYRAELAANLPDLTAPSTIRKKRRRFPSPNWARITPLVEFDNRNSRWVLYDEAYVLLTKPKFEWVPSIYISLEAGAELAKLVQCEGIIKYDQENHIASTQ